MANLFDNDESISVISLWRPWANWVALGWKPLETRRHRRFQSLAGQRIGIHASLKWDEGWLKAAGLYLSPDQIRRTSRFLNVGGAILCTAVAGKVRRCAPEDAWKALIECDSDRYGLPLTDVQGIEAIPMRGRQGIWRVPASMFQPPFRLQEVAA